MHKITSLQNPRIKEAAALRERRERDRAGLFLIEGYRELRRALDAGRKVECLFTCPEFFLGTNESNLIERAGCEVIECTREVFAKISYRDRPDGLLAVAPQLHVSLTDLEKILPPNPLLLVAESIEKPGNLGTILRSADAAGVHGVIVADPTTTSTTPMSFAPALALYSRCPSSKPMGKKRSPSCGGGKSHSSPRRLMPNSNSPRPI